MPSSLTWCVHILVFTYGIPILAANTLLTTICSRNVQVSLTVLLMGVGIATVTDLQLNVLGSVLSLLAIVTTCVAQIVSSVVLLCIYVIFLCIPQERSKTPFFFSFSIFQNLCFTKVFSLRVLFPNIWDKKAFWVRLT